MSGWEMDFSVKNYDNDHLSLDRHVHEMNKLQECINNKKFQSLTHFVFLLPPQFVGSIIYLFLPMLMLKSLLYLFACKRSLCTYTSI